MTKNENDDNKFNYCFPIDYTYIKTLIIILIITWLYYVIYINDNLSNIFRLTNVANRNMAGYISGTDTFKTAAAALKTFNNAPVQNTGYSCFSNGNYASLRDPNGAIVG